MQGSIGKVLLERFTTIASDLSSSAPLSRETRLTRMLK